LNQAEGIFPRWVLRLFPDPGDSRIKLAGKKKGRTMNPLIQLKTISPPLLITLALLCFGLLPKAQAVIPPPDGGYPNFNTAEGQNALFSLTTGSANTAVGWFSLFSGTQGSFNTATGAGALLFNTADQNTAFGAATLLFNTTGSDNTAVGAAALLNNTEGFANTANGVNALFSNTTGGSNTAIGFGTLFSNTGSLNIALGVNAGANLTTGDNNIDIGNVGAATEANTIHIGTQGTHAVTYIAGISDAVIVGTPVVVDANGRLGVAVSSQRFKDEVTPMENASEAVLALKPVIFRYKKEVDSERLTQFGLVAEDVEKVNPDLVVRDKDGKPYSVRYDQVNAMLLNEFLKEHRKNEEQEATIAQLKQDFQSRLVEQQKHIEALAASLHNVSAELEVSKAAPQVVNNQ
jgi:Chaperone of endosialidase